MTYEESNENALHECASDLRNDSRTCEPRDTGLTQPCSLIVLARKIAKRPDLTPHAQRLASLLLQQTYSYDVNPDAMRPLILATIERIQAAA